MIRPHLSSLFSSFSPYPCVLQLLKYVYTPQKHLSTSGLLYFLSSLSGTCSTRLTLGLSPYITSLTTSCPPKGKTNGGGGRTQPALYSSTIFLIIAGGILPLQCSPLLQSGTLGVAHSCSAETLRQGCTCPME